MWNLRFFCLIHVDKPAPVVIMFFFSFFANIKGSAPARFPKSKIKMKHKNQSFMLYKLKCISEYIILT
jgi:hypothetical protein